MLASSGILKVKKHFDDLVPYGDFPVLHCLGIVSLTEGTILYHFRKYYLKKTHDTKTLILDKIFLRLTYDQNGDLLTQMNRI
jgi:hypothetical protein